MFTPLKGDERLPNYCMLPNARIVSYPGTVLDFLFNIKVYFNICLPEDSTDKTYTLRDAELLSTKARA